MQATPARAAIVGGGRHPADELAGRNPLAGADHGIDRFVGRAQAALRDRDDPSTGEHPGIEHGAGAARIDRFARVSGEVDTPVSRPPPGHGRGERMRDR
jgi:hypothetical protein